MKPTHSLCSVIMMRMYLLMMFMFMISDVECKQLPVSWRLLSSANRFLKTNFGMKLLEISPSMLIVNF